MSETTPATPYRMFLLLGFGDVLVGALIVVIGLVQELTGLVIAGVLLAALGLLMALWANRQSHRTQRPVES